MKSLPYKRLRAVLRYDRRSGVFTWIRPPKQHPRMLGKVAGCKATGYVMIKIDGVKYGAHRLAWLYVRGRMPSKRMDHRDGNPFNNAISNLRQATQAQNIANARRVAGKGLPKGVRRNSRKFAARITFKGRQITLGNFKTPEEASAAYARKAKDLYGEFARAA